MKQNYIVSVKFTKDGAHKVENGIKSVNSITLKENGEVELFSSIGRSLIPPHTWENIFITRVRSDA